MPNNNEDVKSQFENNYLGDVNLERFCEKSGVKYYHVCFKFYPYLFVILNNFVLSLTRLILKMMINLKK